jgi:hypothetical protein
MKIIVTLKAILPLQTIQSKDGSKTYTKREFIATEKDSKYPKDICFTLFGEDKVKMLDGFVAGNALEVMYDLQSREFNGRYFTSVDVWNIKPAGAIAATPAATPSAASITPPVSAQPVAQPAEQSEKDDLPF